MTDYHHKPTREEMVIRSIIDAKFTYRNSLHKDGLWIPVIAIYRDYGAGGDHIARHLAKILGVEVYDKEILDSVASAAKVEKHLMAELDDKVRKDKSAWVRSLFTSRAAYPASYRHHLVDVILGIAQGGGIVMGRGAHIILSDRHVFRLRVIGNEEKCAERIAEREAMSIESARLKVAAVNKERAEFLWKMFRERHNNPANFDLIINTDRLDSIEAASQLVLLAMTSMGFDIPPYTHDE